VEVCLPTSNSFDANRIHTVLKNGDTLLAIKLLLFICYTTTAVYDDNCDVDLLSLALLFYNHKNETATNRKNGNIDPGYNGKS
jgi:hypothetical protein